MDSLFPVGSRYADYHIHSYHSHDSNLSCEKILSVAKSKNLKLIGITDHNTIKGGIEARKLASTSEIEVMIGAEIKTPSGEIIGFNLQEEISSRKLMKVIEEIKSQGGLVIIPHPSRWNKKKLSFGKIKDYVDGIEIFNGRNLTTISNIKARYIASKWNFRTVTGSDAHFAFEIGNTEIKAFNWRGFVGVMFTAFYKIINFLTAENNE